MTSVFSLLPLRGLTVLFLPAVCVLLPSCATDEEPIPVTKSGEVMRPRLVGRIASVPSDKRFILIQSYGDWKVATGTVLIAHGVDGRTANLLATGEVMGQYAAADVQSGEVQRGDAVYMREITKSAPPETSPDAAPVPGISETPPPSPATSEVPVP
jgi:hypothetical protein